MSISADLRLYNKIGQKTEHVIPVDIDDIPSGSLSLYDIYWDCWRTFNDVSNSVSINSADDPYKLYVSDPSASVTLLLEGSDTSALYEGAYYWELRLRERGGQGDVSYPLAAFGDIIMIPGKPSATASVITPTTPYNYVEADTTSGDYYVYLDPASNYTGQIYIIKADGLISGSVIVVPDDSETIDDQSQYTMYNPYSSLILYSDGSNWKVVAT